MRLMYAEVLSKLGNNGALQFWIFKQSQAAFILSHLYTPEMIQYFYLSSAYPRSNCKVNAILWAAQSAGLWLQGVAFPLRCWSSTGVTILRGWNTLVGIASVPGVSALGSNPKSGGGERWNNHILHQLNNTTEYILLLHTSNYEKAWELLEPG